MEMRHATEFFRTHPVEDIVEGSVGLDLQCTTDGKSTVVARVLFWDATGQYYVNTFDNVDIPVVVMEALIRATKEHVGID
jgi:hypothetical protein